MGGNNKTPQSPQQPMMKADDQTNQMIANMQRMKDSGIFNTPYQNAMQKHPILMGLANGMQSFGQGLSHQPFYTGNQQNQAELQNTQEQGINAISTLPAQLRMMMAMQGMYNQPGNQSPTNIPGIPSLQPSGSPQAQVSQFVKTGMYNGQRVGMTKDGQIVPMGAS